MRARHRRRKHTPDWYLDLAAAAIVVMVVFGFLVIMVYKDTS